MCVFIQKDKGVNKNQRECCHNISITKEGLVSVEHLAMTVPPYSLSGGREIIGGILPSESWVVHL